MENKRLFIFCIVGFLLIFLISVLLSGNLIDDLVEKTLQNSDISSNYSSLDLESSSSSIVSNSSNESQTDESILGELSPEIVRIVEAYKTKDSSKLTDEKDIFVLKEAEKIINSQINLNMTDYQKEIAIHDYIIKNSKYDTDALDERAEVSPDSLTAYGLLKNKKAVCLGYTRTFQLFMKMLDIECIVIHAKANGGQEHGWNMVKLDGEWYHVDVTWDDPIPDCGDNVRYNYFNVTTSYMKKTDHEWDSSKFPNANSTKYSYNNMK